MTNEYINLIAEVDKLLGSARVFWMHAKEGDEKNQWRVRLDELLDNRLRLMKARDAVIAVMAPQEPA